MQWLAHHFRLRTPRRRHFQGGMESGWVYDRIPGLHGLACQKRSLQLLLPTAYRVKGGERTGFSITLFYLTIGTHDTWA